MNNLNILIYRANILGSNKNIVGWFLPEYYDCINLIRYSNVIFIDSIEFFEIDPTTLAIHFPDMLDSQGNKIFASLSENGKGGDIIEWTIFPSDTQQQRIKGTPYYSGHSVFKITNRMEMMWHSLAPHRKSKVIGIQK